MTENQGNQAAVGAENRRVVAAADREAVAKVALGAAVLGAAPEGRDPHGALGERAAVVPARHLVSAERAVAKAAVVAKDVRLVRGEAAAPKVARADRAAALVMAAAAMPVAKPGRDLIGRRAAIVSPTRRKQRSRLRQRVCPAT